MKNLTPLTLIIVLSAMCFDAFATIRTVSNNPSTLGQFTTIQTAIAASSDGDTIYVHGSPNSYSLFTLLDKKLTIIGPGWAPDKNFPYTATILGCYIGNTSAAGSPSGTELQGLVFQDNFGASLVYNGGGYLSFENLRIIRCKFGGQATFQLSTTNVLFEGCIFTQTLGFNSLSTYENFLFQNNIFYITSSFPSSVEQLKLVVNVRFDHNLFYAQSGVTPVFSNGCNALTLTNNIFVNRDPAASLTNSTFNNNLTYNGGSTAANEPWTVNGNVDAGGNISNQNPQMADQAAVDAGTLNGLLNFSISAGPANNAGSDGKDIGLLYDATGSLNWTNSRNSRMPRIYSMNITNPTVAQGGTLSVSVEARKSN